MTAIDVYHARFLKVLAYIDANLDEALSVEQLSEIAAFSKFHFHRQFSERFGMGVYKYVQLQRLKRASYELAFRQHRLIIDIALAGGYETPESFTRAFKRSLGQTPSDFRKQPQWGPWHETYQPLNELRNHHMQATFQADQVKIVTTNDIRVAVYEHRGDPRLLGNSVRRFIEWRKLNHVPPKQSETFNLVYDNPAETAPESYRFDICAAIKADVAANDHGVVTKMIPGGRCAVLRHIGSDDSLAQTVSYLYSVWLQESGEELRDFPLYFQRVRFFPDVPEHQAITDVFLPLK